MKFTIILIFIIMIASCTKKKVKKDIVLTSPPVGFIDSLSNDECKVLRKPLKNK